MTVTGGSAFPEGEGVGVAAPGAVGCVWAGADCCCEGAASVDCAWAAAGAKPNAAPKTMDSATLCMVAPGAATNQKQLLLSSSLTEGASVKRTSSPAALI